MKQGSTKVLPAGLIVLAGLTVFAATAEDTAPQRFSFAIRGGASMGAYEAGLNWGVLNVGRRISRFDTVLGGRFRDSDLASIAGASAGGINTALSGLTWCMLPESQGGPPNRVDENVFRNLWLVPDVNDLLPPEADSAEYLPDDALLSRKRFRQIQNELSELWGSPVFRPGCSVPLGATVTRVKAENLSVGGIDVQNQRFYFPFELRVQPDGRVMFFFDPADYPRLVDPAMILMPREEDAPPFSISGDRVEEILLATSAFPGGFGRRRLHYCRLEKYVSEGPSDSEPAESGGSLVCPEGWVLAESEFSDGGMFDNLPIGLARKLAELRVDSGSNPLPVTYVFLDPYRVRFDTPKVEDLRACDQPDPPEACRTMTFNLSSEAGLLMGAMGTARKYELYRELTSDAWRLNLGGLGLQLADFVATQAPGLECDDQLPFFGVELGCPEALRRAAMMLDLSHDRLQTPITPPYSVDRLRDAGIATRCVAPSGDADVEVHAECTLDSVRYRQRFGAALLEIVERAGLRGDDIERQIRRSSDSAHNDRALRLTTRGAPVTSLLLNSFGAFLDREFREYDYFVGVYDAAVVVSHGACRFHFSEATQSGAYGTCFDEMVESAYADLGVKDNARARYVFGLLARREFGGEGLLEFAYDPLPDEDRNMRIIHEGLEETFLRGHLEEDGVEKAISVEKSFFTHLQAEGFRPSPNADGSEPLLEQIMEDPDYWSRELVRRATARLVHLEEQAREVYKAREPDPEKRKHANTTLMGATTLVLQTATYKYPKLSWAPSTAPKPWWWRNLVPYEVSIDLAEGDLVVAWQPTWAMTRRDNLGFRLGFGLAGGLIRTQSAKDNREDYFMLGADYSRLTRSSVFSSWGVTPGYARSFAEPLDGDRDTFGMGVHVGLLKNRLRLAVGTRHLADSQGDWFLLIGIADLPGALYWLTR